MQLIRAKQVPQFEKTAAQFLLGENPATHANELLAQLYKQHAFLGQYQVNLTIEGQDDAAGFLYGVFSVSPAAPSPMQAGPQQIGMQAPAPPPDPARTLRIPVIVAAHKAYSFDVFITPAGLFLPLSESRVASAMFDGSPYSASSQTEAQLAAEDAQQGFGGNAGGDQNLGHGAYMKTSSILESVEIPDYLQREFSERLAADQSLHDALTLSPEFRQACARVGSCKPARVKQASAEGSPIDVAVYTKTPGGYEVRCAGFDGNRSTYLVKNAQAERLPLDIRQRVLQEGIAMSTGGSATPLEDVEAATTLRHADVSGVYAVMNKTGSAQRAVVLLDPIMLDGRRTTSVVVVGPSGGAFQEKVAGILCDSLQLDQIEGSEPQGEGLFLIGDRATEFLTIKTKIASPQGITYLFEHPLYGAGQLKMANVRLPVRASGNTFLFPQSARFVPMKSGASYLEDQDSAEKIASRHDLINRVQLLADGSSYSLRGGPMQGVEAEDVSETEALVLLGLLGDTAASALSKVASARQRGEVRFVAARPLPTPAIEKQAAALLDVQHVRVDLVKEAAALAGSDTVDSVLSLNFITPENIQGYLNSMVQLEQAVRKLAELLIGVRLGLADVPESAVSAALNGTERALLGLKKLQIRVGMETRA